MDDESLITEIKTEEITIETDTEDACKRIKWSEHRWTDYELKALLKAIADKVKNNPNCFEKPTSQKFYADICNTANLKTIAKLSDVVVKNKMRVLKDQFVKTNEWIQKSSRGLTEEDKENMVSMCPNFYLLQDIFGSKKSVQLADNFDTGNDALDECDIKEEEVLVEDDIDDIFLESSDSESSTSKDTPVHKVSPKKVTSSKCVMDVLKNITERRAELEEKKLRIKEENLKLKREELEFEMAKHKAEYELKKKQIEQEFQLRKMELNVKYNKN